MTRATACFICCGLNPRLGVTTTARLLADFHLGLGRSFLGFDADPVDRSFAVHFERATVVVDLDKVPGQMALFDRLLVPDAQPRIIDLHHRVFTRFFAVAEQIGFQQEAHRNGMEPIIIFHVDATNESLAAARKLAQRRPSIRCVFAADRGAPSAGTHAYEWLARYPAEEKLVIGALDSETRALFDRPEFSLGRMLEAPPTTHSIVHLTALKAWLTPIFRQMRRFETAGVFDDGDA